jgi:hypothetical protein
MWTPASRKSRFMSAVENSDNLALLAGCRYHGLLSGKGHEYAVPTIYPFRDYVMDGGLMRSSKRYTRAAASGRLPTPEGGPTAVRFRREPEAYDLTIELPLSARHRPFPGH